MTSQDEEAFWGRREKHVYVSRRAAGYNPARGPLRFVAKVIEGKGGPMEVKERGEVVVRDNGPGRFQIKAKLLESDHGVTSLTIQKWNPVGGPHKELAFTFYGQEIDTLLNFVEDIRRLEFPSAERFTVADDALLKQRLSRQQVERLIADNWEVVEAAVRGRLSVSDVETLARRREALSLFQNLLDPVFFGAELKRRGLLRDEDLWQAFFEQNEWIFGYGLSYISLKALDERPLKTRVAGYTLGGRGKEVDGLLKTQAAINSMCFVEIKTATTELVTQYRPGVFAPSSHLAGGTSQIQVTVSRAVEDLGEEFRPDRADGSATGEVLYGWHPRAFLIIGNLEEFARDGRNRDKVRSFELFRRSIRWPEILTFDELFARARFIVEAEEDNGR